MYRIPGKYGRLGKDPKPIQTRTDKAMTTASLAVTLPLRENGETLDGTQWLNLVAFDKPAELLARHGQGDLVNVCGRCQLSRYETRDGETRETLTIIVDTLLSARSTRPGGGRKKQDGGNREPQRQADPEPFQDDPIPF